MSELSRSRLTLLIVAACTLLGLALRLFVTAHTGSLWRDEALFMFVAQLPTLHAVLDFLHYHESHPPLFYLMMRVWVSIFGNSGTAAISMWLPLGRSPAIRLREWLISQASILIGYVPWLPVLLYQVRFAGHPPTRDSIFHGLIQVVADLSEAIFPHLHRLPPMPSLYLLPVLALLTLPLWRLRTEPPERARLLILLGTPTIAAGIAILLTTRTDLTQFRCLLTVLPCLLLAISYGIDLLSRITSLNPLLRKEGATNLAPSLYKGEAGNMAPSPYEGEGRGEVESRTVRPAAALVVLGLLACRDLFHTINVENFLRSNARSVATTIAAQSRPSDLIVITPEYIASSFNYYFPMQNAQIDYPSESRSNAVHFDRFLARMVDPATMRRVQTELTASRAAGRHAWLVTQQGDLPDQPFAPEVLAEDAKLMSSHDYGYAGLARTHQLYRLLIRLYGLPNTRVVPPETKPYIESLSAVLFTPQPAN